MDEKWFFERLEDEARYQERMERRARAANALGLAAFVVLAAFLYVVLPLISSIS